MSVWREIFWTGGAYEVSDDGQVRCAGYTRIRKNGSVLTIRPRVLRAVRRPDGRMKVALGRGCQRLVHRLVAEVFLGPPPTADHQVNHKNGNPSDNRVGNLEWVTCLENRLHALDTGLSTNHSETNVNAKLKDSDIPEIVRMVRGGALHREVAARYGVNQSQVSRIVAGKAWRRVQA